MEIRNDYTTTATATPTIVSIHNQSINQKIHCAINIFELTHAIGRQHKRSQRRKWNDNSNNVSNYSIWSTFVDGYRQAGRRRCHRRMLTQHQSTCLEWTDAFIEQNGNLMKFSACRHQSHETWHRFDNTNRISLWIKFFTFSNYSPFLIFFFFFLQKKEWPHKHINLSAWCVRLFSPQCLAKRFNLPGSNNSQQPNRYQKANTT